MSLDPSIALQVQPAQFQNPLAQYAQISAIQDAQQRNRLLDLTMQDKQRELAQTSALNDAYAKNLNADGTVNSQGLIGSVAQSGYGSAIPGIQKSLTEAETARLAQQKAQVDLGLQRFGALGQVLNGVTDQASYTAAIQHAAQSFGPQAVANIPAAYDPQFVAQTKAQALTVMDQLKQHNDEIDQALRARVADETARHNLVSEGNTVRGQNVAADTARRGQDIGANHYDPNSGVIVNTATGQSSPVMGANGQPIGPKAQQPTEYQSKSAGFGARALASDKILSDLTGKFSPSAVNAATSAQGLPLVGGVVGSVVNSFTSADNQRAEQAQRDFINATLRQESGASIAPGEFENAKQQYFPQPGDSPEVIAQKAANRQTVIRSFQHGAGSAWFDPASPQTASTRPSAQSSSPAAVAPDAALAELQRRAANNPALAARLKAMGH